MEQKILKVSDNREFTIKEFLAIDFDEISKLEDTTERITMMVKKSANLSDEQYATLTIRERKQIMDAMNELNGWKEDFQSSEVVEQKE